jgi:hypothetical protein
MKKCLLMRENYFSKTHDNSFIEKVKMFIKKFGTRYGSLGNNRLN